MALPCLARSGGLASHCVNTCRIVIIEVNADRRESGECQTEIGRRLAKMLGMLLDRTPVLTLHKSSQALTSQQFRVLTLTSIALM